MATNVDQTGVFETVLPNIYIKKVSLLPASAVGQKRAQYTDQTQSEVFETNEFGKKTMPASTRTRSKISNDSRSLTVQVELAIKDEYLKGGKSRWFDNEELIDQLKIRVVACGSEKLTDRLLERRFTPRFLKRHREKGIILEKIISVDKNMGFSLRENRLEKIDRINAYSVSFTATFNIPKYNPKHMTIFAHAFTNQNDYIQQTKKAIVDSPKKYLQGNTTAQTVISDGATMESAYVYTLPNGKIWTGAIHYHAKSDTFMVGIAHSSEPHAALKKSKLANLIVEDHRVLGKLATKKLQLRPAQRGRKRNREQNPTAHNLKITSSEAYISEPMYSYDRVNRLKLLFNFDFVKMVEENTQYGAIYKTADKEGKKKILDGCVIKKLSIFRHRVEKGLRPNQVREVEYDDRTELIGMTSETVAGNLPRHATKRSKNPYDEESEKVTIGAVKEIKLFVNKGTGIRSIGATDYDMEKRTDGKYRYSVEILVEDGTVPFIESQVTKLATAIVTLNGYYTEASKKGASDTLTGQFTTDFIEEQRELYPMVNIDETLRARRRGESVKMDSNIAQAPWLNSIAMYLDVLGNLTNATQSELSQASKLLFEMSDPSTGTVAGLETLINLIQTLEYRIRKDLSSNGTSPTRRMDEIDYDTRTRSFGSRISNNSFTINKYFNTTHDSNKQKNIGYDFLSGGLRKSVGPRRVSMKEYLQRMEAENSKYFTEGYGQAYETFVEGGQGYLRALDLQNKYYSFLTPAIMRIGPKTLKTINRSSGLYGPKQYNSMITVALALNPSLTRPVDSILTIAEKTGPDFVLAPPRSFSKSHIPESMEVDAETYETNIAGSMVMLGFSTSMMTPSQFAQEKHTAVVQSGIEIDEAMLVDPERILGEDTKFITFTQEEDQAVEENTNNTIEGDKDLGELVGSLIMPVLRSSKGLYGSQTRMSTVTKLDNRTEDNIIDSAFSKFEDGETRKYKFVSNLPNQLKSLMLSNTKVARKNWFAQKNKKGKDLFYSAELSGIFYMLYQHINQIEVLVGYKSDALGNPIVSAPTYQPMSRELFNAINKGNSLALCRMVPYKNQLFDFKKSQKMRLPEFDTHFLLGPMDNLAQTADTQETTPEDTTENYETLTEEAFEMRLTQYLPLNTTGNKILVNMLKAISDQDQIPPEFTSTVFIQQPYTATRIGTRFSTSTSARADRMGSSGALSAMKSRTSSQSTGVSKTAPVSTSTTASTPTGGSSSGGSSSGGMSGGGY